MSSVFAESFPLATAADAAAILAADKPDTDRAKLESQILVAWLDFANGAFVYTPPATSVLTFAERALLNPALTKDDLKRVRDAVSALEDAQLTPNWSGLAPAKDPGKGEHDFDGLKQVSGKLQDILKDKTSAFPPATVQQLIDTLVAAANTYAGRAIADARVRGGDAKKIADADAAFAKGVAAAGAGNLSEAFDQFKNAWRKASDA
jgi:hypothetical protein